MGIYTTLINVYLFMYVSRFKRLDEESINVIFKVHE